VKFSKLNMTELVQKSKRIESIDILRGIIMIIMCLDHTRDYYHDLAAAGNPMNIDSTSPALFFTRYITHFCAPIFVLLSGTSIYLQSLRKTKSELSIFLLKRGIWLLFLEIVLNNFLWQFDVFFDIIVFQVIWAIGASMIIMAAIIHLNKYAILTLGLTIVFGHNLLDSITVNSNNSITFIWQLVHQTGSTNFGEQGLLFIGYPMLPWLGIMVIGYALGELYNKKVDKKQRVKVLLWTGVGSLLLFCLLRTFNLYGDPEFIFELQDSFFKNVVSFLRVSKYPPSLHYSLITLGIAFLSLIVLEKMKPKVSHFFLVFGKVPLFFYFVHIAVIHLSSMFLKPFFGDVMYSSVGNNENSLNGKEIYLGVDLIYVYIAWVIIIGVLYIPCLKYMNYKGMNKDKKWLSYF